MIKAKIIDRRDDKQIATRYFRTEDQLITWLRNRLLNSEFGSHKNEIMKLKTESFERTFEVADWQANQDFGEAWAAILSEEEENMNEMDFANILENLTLDIENATFLSYSEWRKK